MALSDFRQRLLNGEADHDQLEAVRREYAYFASIAPKSFRSRLGVHKEEIEGFMIKYKVPLIVGGIVLLPVLLFVLPGIAAIAVFGFIIYLFVSRQSSLTPEYKSYDYRHRLAVPMLRLLDDNMNMGFHYDSTEVIDQKMGYDAALIEAHLLRPINRKHYRTETKSCCSYDWGNPLNKDGFEFLGYHLYYEYTDSDGDTHTETFFNGMVFKFRTSFTTQGMVNIMSTKTKKTLLGEKEKNRFKKISDREIAVIDTENQDFADNFDTIATYEQEAYRFLTPSMIERLLKLRQSYYFSICLKKDVMTVTIDHSSYQKVSQSSFSDTKPYSAPDDPEAGFRNTLTGYRNAILSIYELKDLLDPG